jgi:hypothetical protein
VRGSGRLLLLSLVLRLVVARLPPLVGGADTPVLLAQVAAVCSARWLLVLARPQR